MGGPEAETSRKVADGVQGQPETTQEGPTSSISRRDGMEYGIRQTIHHPECKEESAR